MAGLDSFGVAGCLWCPLKDVVGRSPSGLPSVEEKALEASSEGGYMTVKKGRSTSSKAKKLKVKRETLKDLDTRAKGEKIKGGVKDPTLACR